MKSYQFLLILKDLSVEKECSSSSQKVSSRPISYDAVPAAEEADVRIPTDDEEQTLVADDSDPNHRSAFTPRTTPLYNAGVGDDYILL